MHEKKNWLVVLNLSLGVISFLISILPLIQIVMFVNGWVVTSPFLEKLIVGYSDWIFENNIAFIPILSFMFGLAALIVGFIASISIED